MSPTWLLCHQRRSLPSRDVKGSPRPKDVSKLGAGVLAMLLCVPSKVIAAHSLSRSLIAKVATSCCWHCRTGPLCRTLLPWRSVSVQKCAGLVSFGSSSQVSKESKDELASYPTTSIQHRLVPQGALQLSKTANHCAREVA